jgi:hypothetical protein
VCARGSQVTSLRVCVSVTMDERPLRKYPVKLHLPDPETLHCQSSHHVAAGQHHGGRRGYEKTGHDILGRPKGLAVPLSSPVSLLSSRAAVSFKEAEGTSIGGVMEVRTSERVITQAANIMEAEEDRPLRAECF